VSHVESVGMVLVLFSWSIEPICLWDMTCDTWPLHYQTYDYLPGQRSLPHGQYSFPIPEREGGWVGMGGWLHTIINWAWHSIPLLMYTVLLPLLDHQLGQGYSSKTTSSCPLLIPPLAERSAQSWNSDCVLENCLCTFDTRYQLSSASCETFLRVFNFVFQFILNSTVIAQGFMASGSHIRFAISLIVITVIIRHACSLWVHFTIMLNKTPSECSKEQHCLCISTVCVCACMQACVHACVCACVCVCMCACSWICLFVPLNRSQFPADLDKIWREASFHPEDGHGLGVSSLIALTN